MEPTESLFSRLSSFPWTLAAVVLLLIVVNVVVWWFKPEPKSVGSLVISCVVIVGIAAVVLHFVKAPGRQFDLLKREGLHGIATVLQVESMNVTINRRPQVRLRMRVEAEGRPAYEVTRLELVGIGQSVVPGRRLLVYIDRNKPDRFIIDWSNSTAPLAGAPPTPSHDLSTRLAELDRLRERGQITQAEYDAHRQRMLSDL